MLCTGSKRAVRRRPQAQLQPGGLPQKPRERRRMIQPSISWNSARLKRRSARLAAFFRCSLGFS